MTFEVFPIRIATVEKIVRLIFSNNGIFGCIEQGYFQAPLSLADILSMRAKHFCMNTDLVTLKSTVFANLVKLEDVNKKAKSILEKHREKIL